ncbi:cell wall/surface repeat protein [Clostridium sp. CAG:277]|nr:cell wall/surface repeat protein [Clostridium sp. CAG:277]
MRRNKKVLKAAAWAMAFTMVVTGAEIPVSVTAARKPKLNRKKATLRVGKTIRLRVKNAGKKKVKWSSSKKKIATVNKKGIVKAQNPGKTVIKAKVGGKVLKCRVTVRNPIDSMPSADVSSAVPVTPLPTSRVAATGTPKTSAKVSPGASQKPGPSGNPGASVSPTGSSDVQPSASAGVDPTSGADVQPSASTDVDPTSGADVKPSASAGTDPAGSPEATVIPGASGIPEVTASREPIIVETEEPEPVEATETPNPYTSEVQIITRKDGVTVDVSAWDGPVNTYYLRKQGEDFFEDGMEVQAGTYDIYVFDGETTEDTGEDVTVDGKHLKKAYVDYYTVSFNDEGGSLLRNVEKQVVRKGQKAAEPDFTPGKDNYSFKGWYWYADEELDTEPELYDFDQEVTKTTSLMIEWVYSGASTVYTAEYYLENLDGTYSAVPTKTQEGISALSDAIVRASDYPQSGFEPDDSKNEDVSVKKGENTVARFYYKRKSYTLTWELNGGSKDQQTAIRENILYGQPLVAPTDILKAGYHCKSWLKQNDLPVVDGERMPASDMTLRAVWEITQYSIDYELNGGVFVQGQLPDKTYTIETGYYSDKIPVKKGYTFEGWAGNNGNTPQTSITISQGNTGDKSYQAVWKTTEYKIEYDLDGGSWGSLTPMSAYTIESGDIALPVPVRDGYTFSGWIGNNGTEPRVNVVIAKGSTGNKKYIANWNKKATSTPSASPSAKPIASASTKPTTAPVTTPSTSPATKPTTDPVTKPTASPSAEPIVYPGKILTVGQYKLSLGLTKAQVQEVVGSSVYSKAQIGTSPQGYESYTFNPGDDFKKVIEVQFKNNVVVEMSTIGSFSYGDDVQSGNTTSALSSKGFSDKSGSYKYTLYSKSTGKEYIDVVVDSQRGGQVYGVQIFDKNLGLLDKLLYPKNCTYNSGVNKYQAKLSAYYLNAYRVYHGVYEMSISEEGVAQSHSEYMAEHNSDTMDEGSTTWKTRFNDNYNDGMGLLCKAEYTSYGSPDAFSAVTYAIAKQGSDTKFYQYILMTECVDKNGDTQEVFDLHIECGFANTTSGNKLTFSTFDFYEPL